MNPSNATEYHQSISKLELSKFIDVAVNENLSALIITGSPDMESLKVAWRTLCVQYSEAMADNETKHYMNILKENAMLEATCIAVESVIPVLIKAEDLGVFHKQFYDELNKDLQTNFLFEENQPEQNKAFLQKMNNKLKGLRIKLQLKRIELNVIEEKNIYHKPTEEYYQNILISLSDHAGYQITDKITVFEFCQRIKRLNNYIDKLKQSNHGR